MELNAEINKIFGQEMAKLFAAQISEDELLNKARQVWTDINNSSYWNNDSVLVKEIKAQYSSRMKEEIDKIPHEEIIKKSVDYFLRISDSN